jgi:F0F1-type ATP synthase membrane subunit b/b'
MELSIVIPLAIGFVVIFGSLALLLRGLLSSESNLALKKLQRINEENLKRESELKKKLDDTEKEYQRRIAEAGIDVKKLHDEAESKANVERSQIVESAQRERDAILRDAREEAEHIKSMADLAIREKALELSVGLFQRAVDGELAHLIHNHLFKNVIDNINQYKSRSVAQDVSQAEVVTPFPLTHEQKELLRKALVNIAHKEITIVEKADHDASSLTGSAGLYIKLGSLIIDGTFSNALKNAVKEIKES